MAANYKLTDAQIRQAKAKDRDYRLTDGKGLCLLITQAGGKNWQYRYKVVGTQKERTISFGAYPEVSLKVAREKADAARAMRNVGTDPATERKEGKARAVRAAQNTFEAVAKTWLQEKEKHIQQKRLMDISSIFDRYVFPEIGKKPVGEVTAVDLLAMSEKIIDKAKTVHSVALSCCSQVFRYAARRGLCQHDPVHLLSGDIKLKKPKTIHRAACLDPARIGEILRTLHESTRFSFVIGAALKLLPLIFVRPGELRIAEWSQIDLQAGIWKYKSTKRGVEMIVPLAKQAIEILTGLHAYTGGGRYVFRSARAGDRPMGAVSLINAIRRVGIPDSEMSNHGWRSVARTLIDEELGQRPEWIEMQLAHRIKDPNGNAYNRTAFIDQRKKMMQLYADYLDELRTGSGPGGGNVIPIKPKSA